MVTGSWSTKFSSPEVEVFRIEVHKVMALFCYTSYELQGNSGS